MSVLSREDIKSRMVAPNYLITGYHCLEEQLQPNGFDLTVQKTESMVSKGTIGTSNHSRVLPKMNPIEFSSDGRAELPPGTYLLTLNEIINLPSDMCAIGRPRSSLLRCGVTVNSALWDAGYSGRSQVLMIVHNNNGFCLYKNSRVLQLAFIYLSHPVVEGYQGQYQNENVPLRENP